MRERYKITPAAYLLLFDKDNILLTRRMNTGYMDGSYSVPAGHMEKDELPEDCARRELLEEIGVEADNLSFSSVVYNTFGTQGAYADFFFESSRWVGEINNREPDKCDKVGFFPLDNLPENLVPEVKSALKNRREGRGYSIV